MDCDCPTPTGLRPHKYFPGTTWKDQCFPFLLQRSPPPPPRHLNARFRLYQKSITPPENHPAPIIIPLPPPYPLHQNARLSSGSCETSSQRSWGKCRRPNSFLTCCVSERLSPIYIGCLLPTPQFIRSWALPFISLPWQPLDTLERAVTLGSDRHGMNPAATTTYKAPGLFLDRRVSSLDPGGERIIPVLTWCLGS